VLAANEKSLSLDTKASVDSMPVWEFIWVGGPDMPKEAKEVKETKKAEDKEAWEGSLYDAKPWER
jgi:hypothetical protein